MKIKLSLLLIFSAVFATLQAQQSQLLDRIVAIVDDEIILDSEVTETAFMACQQMNINPMKEPQKFNEMRGMVLKNMVLQEVLLIQADKDTIEADENRVKMNLEGYLNNLIRQLGGEENVEKAFNMTMSQIRRKQREEFAKQDRVSMLRQQFEMNVSVGRREVKEFYNQMKDSLGIRPESYDISHILIETQPGEKARMEAMEKIVRIRKLVADGQDFASLAKEFSQDSVSAINGGEIGFMASDELVREYVEAAVSLQPGETSQIVETQFGFHIIQLLEKRGDKINTRHILIRIVPTKEDEQKAVETIKSIYQQLKDGASFEDMVAKYSEDEESKNDNGHLGMYDKSQIRNSPMKDWLFVLDGLEPGQFSDPVHTTYGYHILKLNSRDMERKFDFEKDYDNIEAMALQYKKQKEFNDWVEEIKEDIYIEYK